MNRGVLELVGFVANLHHSSNANYSGYLLIEASDPNSNVNFEKNSEIPFQVDSMIIFKLKIIESIQFFGQRE